MTLLPMIEKWEQAKAGGVMNKSTHNGLTIADKTDHAPSLKNNERVIYFQGPAGKRGEMSIREMPDGTMQVWLFNLDPSTKVVCPEEHYIFTRDKGTERGARGAGLAGACPLVLGPPAVVEASSVRSSRSRGQRGPGRANAPDVLDRPGARFALTARLQLVPHSPPHDVGPWQCREAAKSGRTSD